MCPSEDDQKEKSLSHHTIQQLIMEKDQALADLNSVEKSLADLFRRYEKMKDVLDGFRKVTDYWRLMNGKQLDFMFVKTFLLWTLLSVQFAQRLTKPHETELKRLSFPQNEEVLKKCAQEYLTRVRKEEQRYQALKIHAEEKLDK